MRPIATAVLLLALHATAQERPRVAVLGLSGKNVSTAVLSSLTGLLGTEIARLDQFQVLGEDDVRGLVKAAQLASVLGCQGDACAGDYSRIAQELNAGYVVTGDVGQVGTKYLLNLTLLDARKSRVENRATVEAASLDELPSVVRRGALALFGIAGQIALWNQVEGAQMFLDEKLVGLAPVKKIDVKREGEYTVRVSKDDSTPFEKKVAVKAGEIVRVKVESYTFRELEEWSSERRTWGAALTAGGAVVGAAGGVLWFLPYQNDRQLASLDLRRREDVVRGQEIASGTLSLTLAAAAASVVGTAAVGTGGCLLLDNPWQERLEQFAVAPAADGTLLAMVRF